MCLLQEPVFKAHIIRLQKQKEHLISHGNWQVNEYDEWWPYEDDTINWELLPLPNEPTLMTESRIDDVSGEASTIWNSMGHYCNATGLLDTSLMGKESEASMEPDPVASPSHKSQRCEGHKINIPRIQAIDDAVDTMASKPYKEGKCFRKTPNGKLSVNTHEIDAEMLELDQNERTNAKPMLSLKEKKRKVFVEWHRLGLTTKMHPRRLADKVDMMKLDGITAGSITLILKNWLKRTVNAFYAEVFATRRLLNVSDRSTITKALSKKEKHREILVKVINGIKELINISYLVFIWI